MTAHSWHARERAKSPLYPSNRTPTSFRVHKPDPANGDLPPDPLRVPVDIVIINTPRKIHTDNLHTTYYPQLQYSKSRGLSDDYVKSELTRYCTSFEPLRPYRSTGLLYGSCGCTPIS